MPAPKAKKFARGDRVYVRAQQVWLILIAHIYHTKKIRLPFKDRLLEYGDLAELMGRDRRAAIGLGRELGIVGEYCLQNRLPAVNCIVINQDKHAPGRGVVRRNGITWQDEAKEAFDFDLGWFDYRVPTTGAFRQVLEP